MFAGEIKARVRATAVETQNFMIVSSITFGATLASLLSYIAHHYMGARFGEMDSKLDIKLEKQSAKLDKQDTNWIIFWQSTGLSKLSSISMQQVVNLIEDEDESWSEEAESLSPRVKKARRCKHRIFQNECDQESKGFLPCGHTISRQIDDACSTVQNHVSTDVSNLMLFGGGLTLDFAKNRVDYIAVTGYYIGHNWQKKNMVLLFEPVPGMQKTADNVSIARRVKTW
uniref:Uncharacterized protein n=1 Tax=Ditylenchus dipsaci TaxID=166011 RepID=A0A915DXS6_9BILA